MLMATFVEVLEAVDLDVVDFRVAPSQRVPTRLLSIQTASPYRIHEAASKALAVAESFGFQREHWPTTGDSNDTMEFLLDDELETHTSTTNGLQT